MSADSTSSNQARYQAWKDRLSQTEAAERAASVPDEVTVAPDSTSSYWSAESLFRDSELETEKEQRASDEERERVERAAELLGVLGLPADATLDDAAARYKVIAKKLHPDRHHDSDAEAKAAALQLVEYSAAYGELKGLLD